MSKQVKLPAVIETFIKASNDHDSNAYLSTFSEDALVNDIARNFWGKDQIKNWADEEIITPKVTFKANEIVEHYGDFLITALIDGNYDKSKAPDPTYLDYFFTVNNDKIVKMIVIKNNEKSAKV
jgi:ketosteroid isomerase-like protein